METYGRCIAEPFSLGRCVVTKKTGVALDIIRNGENGMSFSTTKELVEILVMLHKEPQLLVNMANAAFTDKYLFSPAYIMSCYLITLKNS